MIEQVDRLEELRVVGKFTGPDLVGDRLVAARVARWAVAEIKWLREWKHSAQEVMPPMQEIAKVLNIPLGTSIHDRILPGIERLRAENDKLRADTLVVAAAVGREVVDAMRPRQEAPDGA